MRQPGWVAGIVGVGGLLVGSACTNHTPEAMSPARWPWFTPTTSTLRASPRGSQRGRAPSLQTTGNERRTFRAWLHDRPASFVHQAPA